MFGREARYPSEVSEHYEVDGSFEMDCEQETVGIDIERHKQIMDIVDFNVEKTINRRKRRLSNQTQQSLQVGYMVWRRNVRSEQRKGGKLDPDYFGPFMITKIEGKSVDLVDSDGRPTCKVNIDHLKKHHEETPRIPYKLRRHQQFAPSQPPDKTSSPPPPTPLLVHLQTPLLLQLPTTVLLQLLTPLLLQLLTALFMYLLKPPFMKSVSWIN
ncbi:uncharacterized protein LOC132854302 [Tachysurus vachellii]|uniref:uncharacterized protein LOC132854302 n=1 Tax=Tachysurus vachellii TaxID=175792 RepID=UPI00296AAFCB|nr:uncharacterized protein LOC132854302 [Tachysurus vachellii]